MSFSSRYFYSTRILVCTRTQNSTTRNKMAFSMTSALSSRVSATTSSLRTQRVQKRQSASFKCNAYDEAEIDKKVPTRGLRLQGLFFFLFPISLSLFLSLSLSFKSRYRTTTTRRSLVVVVVASLQRVASRSIV